MDKIQPSCLFAHVYVHIGQCFPTVLDLRHLFRRQL